MSAGKPLVLFFFSLVPLVLGARSLLPLDSLRVNPRLTDEEWLQIIGQEKKEQTYTVRRRDTLWDISQKMFKSPWYWRKLWQVNPGISNPHELSIGQILRFYQDSDRLIASEIIRIPVIKLTPVSPKEFDGGLVSGGSFRDRFLPKWVVLNDEEAYVGEITEAYTKAEGISEHDELFVRFFQEGVSAGERFTIVREERQALDSTKLLSPRIGQLARIVGELVISSKGEALYRAEIKSISGPIRRGDKLLPLQKPVEIGVRTRPPDDMQADIVFGEEPEKKVFGQGELVLINKGTVDGMRVGYVFRVLHDVDPLTGKWEAVEPSHKGEVQIVQAAQLASIGVIVRNTEVIEPGDALVPYQRFPPPQPPPLRNASTIELD